MWKSEQHERGKRHKGGFFRRLFKREKTEAPEVHEEVVEASPTAGPGPIEAEPELAAEPSEEKAGFFKLKRGLTKTRKGFLAGLDEVLLAKKQLDEQMVERSRRCSLPAIYRGQDRIRTAGQCYQPH